MTPPPPWEAIGERVLRDALADVDLEPLFRTACEGLREAGVAVVRGHLALPSLHPMFRAYNVTWTRGEGLETARHTAEDEETDQWRRSPLRALLEEGRDAMRFLLEEPGEWQRYPVLAEFREAGATEYRLGMVGFARDRRASLEFRDGMLVSWLCDRPGGFDARDEAALEHVTLRIAVAAKMRQRAQTTENVLTAYLGSDTGRRVLRGQIRRGDMDVIRAVIWYSDLRASTALAERLAGEDFMRALNAYFECTAGAVLDHGGEVLRFIGDAVLAIFPVSGTEGVPRWARVALAAARSARERMRRLNAARREAGEPELGFGVALHAGDVWFGNIGVAQRVEFSVIGPAANEVCRMEGLTKALGEPVVVSSALASALPLPWRSLGRHRLRGVGEPREVFAPPTEPGETSS